MTLRHVLEERAPHHVSQKVVIFRRPSPNITFDSYHSLKHYRRRDTHITRCIMKERSGAARFRLAIFRLKVVKGWWYWGGGNICYTVGLSYVASVMQFQYVIPVITQAYIVSSDHLLLSRQHHCFIITDMMMMMMPSVQCSFCTTPTPPSPQQKKMCILILLSEGHLVSCMLQT